MTIKEYFNQVYANNDVTTAHNIEQKIYAMFEGEDDSFYHFTKENHIDVTSEDGMVDLSDWVWKITGDGELNDNVWDMCGE